MQDEVYFRPHENDKLKFYKNIKDFMQNTYDLQKCQQTKKKYYNIKQVRDVYFETDEYGLRNSINLNNADFILVGDLFIVGNVIHTKTYSIRNFIKIIKCYNIAFPGAPISYEKSLEFQNEISKQSKIILFYLKVMTLEIRI